MFSYNQRTQSSTGKKITGIMGGLNLTSTGSIASNDIRQLFGIVTTAMLNLRDQYNTEMTKTTDNTKRFYDESGKSAINRAIIGNNYDLHNRLYRKMDDQTFDPRMLFKNPYDKDSGLNVAETKYLKAQLWQINKFAIPKLSAEERRMSYEEAIKIDKVKELISDSDSAYFFAPLKRGGGFGRIKGMTMTNLVQEGKERFTELQDFIDPREFNKQQLENVQGQHENYNKMYNQYTMSPITRENMIKEHIGNLNYFETNLDILALDFMYAHVKEKVMNEILPIITAFTTNLKYRSKESGEDVSEVLSYIQDKVKTDIFAEPIIPKELEGIAKGISSVRSLTSTLVVAGRPIMWVKELLVGGFQNSARAWTKVYGDESFDIKSLTKAYQIITGSGLHNYGNIFKGKSDLADFTLVEALNNTYGMANMDVNDLVGKTKVDRTGLNAGMSR